RLVPVDFETEGSWWDRLVAHGFDPAKPAVVTSTGVSMYLTRGAITSMFRQISVLAQGSTFVMTFLLPMELMDPAVRPGFQMAEKGARANGTPFLSFFTPTEIAELARDAGLKEVRHVSSGALAVRYFAGRQDGFRPPDHAEELLLVGQMTL